MTNALIVPVAVTARGRIPAEIRELAEVKIGAALKHAARPVLSARVTLAISADPAVARPAAASAHVIVNGRPVEAHATAETMRAAIELLAKRVKIRLGKFTAELAEARHPAEIAGRTA